MKQLEPEDNEQHLQRLRTQSCLTKSWQKPLHSSWVSVCPQGIVPSFVCSQGEDAAAAE